MNWTEHGASEVRQIKSECSSLFIGREMTGEAHFESWGGAATLFLQTIVWEAFYSPRSPLSAVHGVT